MPASQVTQELLMDTVSVAQAGTKYSNSRKFHQCTGAAVLWIKTTAGSITVSQQCSMDDVAWYDPVDTSDGALGVVRSALGVTTGVYVVFTPVLTEYIRFKVVEGNSAATVVTLKLSFRLEV